MTSPPPISAFAAIVAALMISACAQAPAREVPAQPAPEAKPKERVEPLPNQELTGQILYQALLAEIAGQRGNFGLSASAYLDLARTTRDPRIARRAAEISLHGRNLEMTSAGGPAVGGNRSRVPASAPDVGGPAGKRQSSR
ncbi:MAG: hypothetical protein M5R42_15650 [Rhodocyclaceae bacterium]|nr:hypothetical protein [Rhodocyclaceae bacterium]